MARGRSQQKKTSNADGTRLESRDEKRARKARNREKLAEHKKLIPALLVSTTLITSLLPY